MATDPCLWQPIPKRPVCHPMPSSNTHLHAIPALREGQALPLPQQPPQTPLPWSVAVPATPPAPYLPCYPCRPCHATYPVPATRPAPQHIYDRPMVKKELLIAYILVVAQLIEGGGLAAAQFEALRSDLKMTAADLVQRFRWDGGLGLGGGLGEFGLGGILVAGC